MDIFSILYFCTGQANYAASKAGVIGMTKAASMEMGQFNIR